MCGQVLIIGFGNELAGDDAVGLLIVRELKKHLAVEGTQGVDIEEADGTYAALLDHAQNHQLVIIADAIVDNEHAGEVRSIDIGIGRSSPGIVSSHGVDACSVIGLLRAGGRPIEHAVLVGVLINQPDEFTGNLSQPVRDSIPRAVKTITTWIEKSRPSTVRWATETAGMTP